MEKKRRARINVSLEQLKSLLEKHYSHQIRKRKLEKADILELSVTYMKSLQNSLQGLWLVPSGPEYPSGFRGCLPGVSQLLRREEEGGGLRCPLVPERACDSTMDSAGPVREAPELRGSCVPTVWAPAPAAGSPRSPPPRLFLPGGLPGSSTSVPAPQPRLRADPSQRGESQLRPGPFSGPRAPGSHRHKAHRAPPRRRGAPAHPTGTLPASADPHPRSTRRAPPGLPSQKSHPSDPASQGPRPKQVLGRTRAPLVGRARFCSAETRGPPSGEPTQSPAPVY
ncbi:PREDICTED: transcription factor HES-3 [Galeopterus variegatus]|uniref:Transcription factor HES-3 n=1 Tax=Galeopterus variegatus TaxID=482537 RepID=A0ABM0QA55_GALVR|nr:PREDICTED: transcription factor HES-3 [Galeopterus variegatus]